MALLRVFTVFAKVLICEFRVHTEASIWHTTWDPRSGYKQSNCSEHDLFSIIKCHNHKLQTSPWHREEEPHNNQRHQEDKQSKATSPIFPIKMIAKLERTQSNAQQNIEQLQNPTMGVTINKESTTTEPAP